MDNNAAPKVHAAFDGPADTTLVSADDVEFHIESSQLSRTSGWFRTLFTLPQGERKQAHTISVSEDSLTLEVLLRLCCGTGLALGLSRLTNLGDLELYLRAAEKYEMAEALEILPLLLYKANMRDDVLHLYALAARYGQEDVAASALKRLVAMRLDFDAISHLDYTQLRGLVARRQERVAKFCSLLSDVTANGPFFREACDCCTRSAQHYSHYCNGNAKAWLTMALSLQAEFTEHPSIEAFESNELVKAQISVIEALKCPTQQCQLQQYEWKNIRRRLLDAMDAK